MATKQHNEPAEVDPTECATAWFALLERSRMVGDFESAARAQRELKRLGVSVKYRRQERRVTNADDQGPGQ